MLGRQHAQGTIRLASAGDRSAHAALHQYAGDDRPHAACWPCIGWTPGPAVSSSSSRTRIPAAPSRIASGSISSRPRSGQKKIKPGGSAHRGDRGQHGAGARAGGRAEGLPAAARDPGQDEPGEDLSSESDGRRSRDDALGCRQGSSGVLPGSRCASRARDARQLLRQPVRQRSQHARARRNHRAGDLGAAGSQARCGRVWRRHRRNDHRPVALLRAHCARCGDGAGRPGEFRACRLRAHRQSRAFGARAGSSKASAETTCRRSAICRA